MNPDGVRSHRRPLLAVSLLVVAAAAFVPPVRAQESGAPDSFSVNIAATGALIEVSAPAAVPLDVLAGIAHAQVGVNSQPRIQSTGAPVFVPLLQDAGLLGGTGGLAALAVRLGPGLVVGLPTLFGLDPLPIDPSGVPLEPLAQALAAQDLPGLPPLGCTASLPDVPHEVECGGGAQNFFGYRVGAASARSIAEGDPSDPSTLASRTDAAVASVEAADGNFAPLSMGTLGATAEARILDGALTGTASAGASDIDIVHQLRIEGVTASFAGALTGTVEGLQQQLDCNITGVSIGGQDFELGTDAITIGGNDSEVPPALQDSIGDLLGSLGGNVGEADLGSVTLTPNPAPVSEVADNGTSMKHRFGCLEIRYRIPTSGTDVRITLGNVAVTMTAFTDAPFASPGGAPVAPDLAASGEGFSPPEPSAATQSGLDTSPATRTGGASSLPVVPDPGSAAPPPVSGSMLRNSAAVGWGIDGAWLAPFSLLALSLPLLARARRFSPTTSRS